MKKNAILLGLIWGVGALFSSCQNDYEEIVNGSAPNVVSRALNDANIVADWMTWETVELASGETVVVPWSTSKPVAGNIPLDIRTDVLPEDGWKLILHTLNEEARAVLMISM